MVIEIPLLLKWCKSNIVIFHFTATAFVQPAAFARFLLS